MGKKDNLHNRNNKRLNNCDPTNNEGTAAWQNPGAPYNVDMVNKPSIESVVEAKEWVDDGSKL